MQILLSIANPLIQTTQDQFWSLIFHLSFCWFKIWLQNIIITNWNSFSISSLFLFSYVPINPKFCANILLILIYAANQERTISRNRIHSLSHEPSFTRLILEGFLSAAGAVDV